jgi:uncharacterized protein YbaR (Trm112 family)
LQGAFSKYHFNFILQTCTVVLISYDYGMTQEKDKVIDPKLLEILVCPVTKATLRYDNENLELISEAAGLAYPIRDGIPIMLPDEARKLDDD